MPVGRLVHHLHLLLALADGVVLSAVTLPLASPWHAFSVGTCTSPGTQSCVEASGVRPPRCKEPFPPGQRKKNSTLGSIQFDLHHLAKFLPPLAERLGDLSVVHLGGRLDDLVMLDLALHHKRVHWTLDVVRSCFFVLEI